MKQLLEQPTALMSVWGLNIVSFLNDSLPFLQATSLLLAITLSIMSMIKMSKNKNESEEENSDPII